MSGDLLSIDLALRAEAVDAAAIGAIEAALDHQMIREQPIAR